MKYIRLFVLSVLSLLPMTLAAQDKFVLAAEDDWYPYSAKIGMTAQGLSVEIISAAYKAAGATVSYELVPFSRAMAGVTSGRYIGCFNAGKSEQLEIDYLVPEQSITESAQIVWGNLKSLPVKSYKDFEGKTVGLANAYTYSPLLTENKKIIKTISRLEVSNLKMLALGRIDYTIVDYWVAKNLIHKNKNLLNGRVRPIGELQKDVIIPVFSKTHPDGPKAMSLYDKGMTIIKNNGTYETIIKSWEDKFKDQ